MAPPIAPPTAPRERCPLKAARYQARRAVDVAAALKAGRLA
ncbi:hypothetical protein ACFY4C_32995 [Actinomadura viridis]